jgi:TonB family protein
MQYATPNRRAGAPFWAIVAAAALLVCAVFTAAGAQEPSKPSPDPQRQPRPATGTPQSSIDKTAPVAAAASPSNQKPALPFDEEIPPGGADNLMFSDAAIRYCLAQIIRIDAIRSLVDRYERGQVDYFNGLVADYNNRCAHYRYMEGARESARAIVEPNRTKIESDARDAYRKRFAAADKDVASKSSLAVATPPGQPQQPARSPAAAVPSTPSPTGQPGTTLRPEVKPQLPLATTPSPSTPSAQAASPAAKAAPELKRQPPLATTPAPSTSSAQGASPPAAKSQPELKQQPSSATAPLPSTSSVQAASPPATTPQPTVKQQPSPATTTPSPSAPAAQATSPATTTAQSEVKPRAEGTSAASQGERAVAIGREPESKQQSPSPTAAAPNPQAPGSTVATAQPDAKQQSQSAAASVPAVPAVPSSAAAVAGAQQPQSPPQPARAAAAKGDSPAAPPPPPASKPPAVAKAQGDSGPGTAVERFASEVQRVASQVLDQRDYPKDARGKDWQGTTQIEVRYAAAGYIQSIVVGESSGYPPLDDTALQIARNMRLPNAPEELRSREFAVRFPIVFRLRNP